MCNRDIQSLFHVQKYEPCIGGEWYTTIDAYLGGDGDHDDEDL